ncbi:DUF58 domain-containing protein [Paenibacillus sp. UNC451MF]|uniref:DUF58 domain-containing protein n=1 Tax=Paenibacillus sp. UNC451MF TaxID=1449063 RepID=UPI000569EF4C|nr:DUF58 domain-containing protein [Paenibacillus sp. UNC451MF]
MSVHGLLFITLLVLVIQVIVFKALGHKGLTYERYFSAKGCFEGEEAEMVERIANRNLIPVPWLRLESLIHAGLRFYSQANLDINNGQLFQNHKSLFSLMPYTQITRRHRIYCSKRGCYRLNTASLTYGDLVGLYRNTLRLSLDTELLVYPKLASLDEMTLPSHSWQGDWSVRRWIVEDPFMISGAREYRYGDPLNGVNWKATARSGRLQVHQRDYTADHRLMIYLNVEDHEKMWNQVNDEALFEKGLSIAAAIAQRAIELGMEVGFSTNAYSVDSKEPVRVEPRNGAGHMTYLLETMAKVVVARSIPFDTLLDEEAVNGFTNQDILIISAYVSDKMRAPMEQLRYQGNAVDTFLLEKALDQPEEQAGEPA